LGRNRGDLTIRLESLSEAAAEALGNLKGDLWIIGLSSLSENTAAALAKHKGSLTLGLTTVSEEVAECLGKHKRRLSLQRVKRLSDKAVESLCRHEGFLDLWGLDNISDTAIQSLCKRDKDDLFLSPFYESQVNKARKNLALQNRRAKSVAEILYPRLVEARKAGATFLRSVFEGFSDDGCFFHTFLKNGSPIQLDVDPDTDIESLIEENNFIVDGDMNGSVSILEIDLNSGDAIFWDAQQASETERFAELLLRCEWNSVTSLNATVTWLSEDGGDSYEAQLSKVGSTPRKIGSSLEEDLSSLFYRLESLEGGDELTHEVRDKCGLKTDLHVDVEKRTFTFSGNGKRLSVKVPKNALDVTRFNIDLGPNSSKATSKSKKRGT
jgi:hypothetical protein